MNRMTKRLVSVLLALALVASLSVAAFADADGTTAANAYDTVPVSNSEPSTVNGGQDDFADDYIRYSLGYVQADPTFYFDLTYTWDANLTWTFVKSGSAGAWFRDSETLAGKQVSALVSTDGVALKAAEGEISQRTSDTASDAGAASKLGPIFTITNNNAAYDLGYVMTIDTSVGAVGDVAIKTFTPNTTYEKTNSNYYGSIATIGASVTDNTIGKKSGTGQEEVVSSASVVVYPSKTMNQNSDVVSAGAVKLSFAATKTESGTTSVVASGQS